VSDELEGIRQRWAGVEWHYAQNKDEAWIHDQHGDALITARGPGADARQLLRLASLAPDDVRALLAWPGQAEANVAALRQAAVDLTNQLAVLRYPDESTLWRLGGQGLERDYQALKAALACDAGAALLAELAELRASQAATQAFVRGLIQQAGADDVPLTVAIGRMRVEALAARRLAAAARSAVSGPDSSNYATLSEVLAAWEAVTRKEQATYATDE